MDFVKILDLQKQHIDDIRYIGYHYLRQGKYDIAIKIFEALLILDYDNVYDLQTLGALYLEVQKNEKALEYIDLSLKLEKNHLPTLLNRVKALFSLGYKKQGLELAKKLILSKEKKIKEKANAFVIAYS